MVDDVCKDNIKQVCYYSEGVGTSPFEYVLGGFFALGLSEHIRYKLLITCISFGHGMSLQSCLSMAHGELRRGWPYLPVWFLPWLVHRPKSRWPHRHLWPANSWSTDAHPATFRSLQTRQQCCHQVRNTDLILISSIIITSLLSSVQY